MSGARLARRSGEFGGGPFQAAARLIQGPGQKMLLLCLPKQHKRNDCFWCDSFAKWLFFLFILFLLSHLLLLHTHKAIQAETLATTFRCVVVANHLLVKLGECSWLQLKPITPTSNNNCPLPPATTAIYDKPYHSTPPPAHHYPTTAKHNTNPPPTTPATNSYRQPPLAPTPTPPTRRDAHPIHSNQIITLGMAVCVDLPRCHSAA